MTKAEQERKEYRDMQVVMATTLARIDERTANNYTLTEKQEAHLEKINGTIIDQGKQIAQNKDRIATQWKIGGGVFLLFVTVVGVALSNYLGLF